MKWPWSKTPPPLFPCGTCGEPRLEPGVKHRIGDAFVNGKPHAKFCDGTEVAL